MWATNTHTCLTALFLGLPRSAGTRKVKPVWILLEQETVSSSGISWAICKSAPCFRQITTPVPHHSVFYRPDVLPAAQPTASKHWRQYVGHKTGLKQNRAKNIFVNHACHLTATLQVNPTLVMCATIHTHRHTCLTALCPGLPGWAGTRKVKPIWISLKQETVSGSGISWAVCKYAPHCRQIPADSQHPTTQFFTDRMPFLLPNKQHQSAEGLCVQLSPSDISADCWITLVTFTSQTPFLITKSTLFNQSPQLPVHMQWILCENMLLSHITHWAVWYVLCSQLSRLVLVLLFLLFRWQSRFRRLCFISHCGGGFVNNLLLLFHRLCRCCWCFNCHEWLHTWCILPAKTTHLQQSSATSVWQNRMPDKVYSTSFLDFLCLQIIHSANSTSKILLLFMNIKAQQQMHVKSLTTN